MQYIGNNQFQNEFTALVNRPNYSSGFFSVPNLYAPVAMLGMDSYTNPMPTDPTQGVPIVDDVNAIVPQPINDSALGLNFGQYPVECLVLGANCPDNLLGQSIVSVGSIFKKIGVLFFALLLLAFGLYLLAKSTETGAAVVNVASKI